MSRQIASTREFTWNPKNQTLVAESSDLHDLVVKPIIGSTPGFKLQSQRTGKIIDVVQFYVERDRENEVIATHFKPLRDNNTNLTVIILND